MIFQEGLITNLAHSFGSNNVTQKNISIRLFLHPIYAFFPGDTDGSSLCVMFKQVPQVRKVL